MRYFTLVLAILIMGCSTKGIVATIFLKEDKKRLYNIKTGEDCSESGYEVLQNADKSYTLITYYSNCEIHTERHLEEFEIKNWRPSGNIKIN